MVFMLMSRVGIFQLHEVAFADVTGVGVAQVGAE
jgi:hypothetical protein